MDSFGSRRNTVNVNRARSVGTPLGPVVPATGRLLAQSALCRCCGSDRTASQSSGCADPHWTVSRTSDRRNMTDRIDRGESEASLATAEHRVLFRSRGVGRQPGEG